MKGGAKSKCMEILLRLSQLKTFYKLILKLIPHQCHAPVGFTDYMQMRGVDVDLLSVALL